MILNALILTSNTPYLTINVPSFRGRIQWPWFSYSMFFCGGGEALWPPLFFCFGATKSPKVNLGTFLGLKTTWKAILNIFRSLCLVTRGRQISINFIVEKFKIFKVLSFKGVMHLKWKLRTCRIQIEHEKVGFVSKKIKNFKIFWFSPNAQGPP